MPNFTPGTPPESCSPDCEDPIIFLSPREVTQRTSLSRSTLERWSQDGKFPEPVPLGEFRKAWIEAEVSEWQMAAKTQRNNLRKR
ncbi:helix-turn-helix transcriptional regulator [Cognatishimia sp. 1_MG-2023]|uniref:helix-turn-helix transcriptional regulator n=1 Tax=Cognatishimia sp. 1_MG-2023 TaxID=3062642 RepID=UPI0034A31BE3